MELPSGGSVTTLKAHILGFLIFCVISFLSGFFRAAWGDFQKWKTDHVHQEET